MSDQPVNSGTWVAAHKGQEAIRVRKCRLEVVAGPDAGKSEVFASPCITVGRVGADLTLSDRRVSALHFEIRLEPTGYRLRDLASTNGTQVWGMRIVEALIGPGAVLSLGDSAVRFVPLADSAELPLFAGDRLCGMVGGSTAMRGLFERVVSLAATDTTVLITGESGTGKERVAEAIHERSPRRRGPFVVLDCSAIPAHLFEAELFGHVAGAFTGANRGAPGLFEAASGGTLFLDEVGELPMEVQPKLLRAVETRRVRRLGADSTTECDVRLVAATNRDLIAEVGRKAFRGDLYYRMAVARVTVPPLRERLEDLEMLIEHILADLTSGALAPLPPGFLDWARGYSWPGNVRELRNAVERAVITQAMPDPVDDLSARLQAPIDLTLPFREHKRRVVDDFERRYLHALLDAHDWNIASAARAAGVDRMSIYKLMQRLEVERTPEAGARPQVVAVGGGASPRLLT
jgi:transcriptional regulator with GAF, ATPase, and Fis domain